MLDCGTEGALRVAEAVGIAGVADAVTEVEIIAISFRIDYLSFEQSNQKCAFMRDDIATVVDIERLIHGRHRRAVREN